MTGQKGRPVPAAEVNHAAYDHEELKRWTDVADSRTSQAFADEWTLTGAALMDAAETLRRAVVDSEAGWTGEAAEAMRARLGQISAWSNGTGSQIAAASQSVARQSEAADAARRAMPDPVAYDPAQMIREAGRGGLLGMAALPQRLYDQKQRHDAAHEEAVRVVADRDAAMSAAAGEVAVFQPPPALDGGSGGGAFVDSRDFSGGGAGDGGGSPSGRGFEGSGGGPGGSVVGSGSGGADRGPGNGSSVGTTTPGGFTPSGREPIGVGGPNGSGPGAGASGPGGLGGLVAGGPGSGPGTGGGAVRDGRTGAGGGTGGRSGFGTGSGGRGGSLGGGGFGGGGAGAGAGGPAGRGPGVGGMPGVVPGAAEAAAARGAGRGGAGMGGLPLGGGGRREEDVEHQRPEFLQEPDPDGIFDSDELTAPSVIGGPDDE